MFQKLSSFFDLLFKPLKILLKVTYTPPPPQLKSRKIETPYFSSSRAFVISSFNSTKQSVVVLPDSYPPIHTKERTIRKVMGGRGGGGSLQKKVIHARQNVRKSYILLQNFVCIIAGQCEHFPLTQIFKNANTDLRDLEFRTFYIYVG